jgi:hypothetical protein
MAAHLRVYTESDNTSTDDDGTVRVNLGDLLPLLALAQRHNYVWLRDFLDDTVSISSDLYEVLQAFRYYRPPA